MDILILLGLVAASHVTLDSDIFVERARQDASGHATLVLEAPKAVATGDRLLFVLSYRNQGAEAARDFVLTNPVPDSVIYAGADGPEPEVSVDWGRSWGSLSTLSVTRPGGRERKAEPGDVTHVRWIIRDTIGAGESGKLAFRAVAR